MLPEFAALFEAGRPPFRAGENLRVTGINGVYTVTASPRADEGLTADAASTGTRPLEVLRTGRVIYSTICGAIPTIGGTAINATTPPTLTLPGSGTYYVRCTITGVLDVVDTIFARPAFTSITSVVLTVESSASDPADLVSASGVFSFDLATVVNGVPYNAGFGPIYALLADTRDSSASALIWMTWGGYSA